MEFAARVFALVGKGLAVLSPEIELPDADSTLVHPHPPTPATARRHGDPYTGTASRWVRPHVQSRAPKAKIRGTTIARARAHADRAARVRPTRLSPTRSTGTLSRRGTVPSGGSLRPSRG